MSSRATFPDDGAMHTTALLSAAPTVPPVVGTALIEAHDLTRIWGKGSAAQVGVTGVDLSVGRGEIVAIIGPSGSGKSTLGALLAGIDRPTSGSLVIDGTRIDRMKDDRLAAWRGSNVGIVFQDFHLLPTLTAAENVELGIELAGSGAGRRLRRSAARAALDRVGLGDHARKLPAQMSGGEQQRVGVARAMVSNPPLIVADEPTGALDQANGHAIFELLTGLARTGSTVLVITHDLALAGTADRTISMIDGRVADVAVKGVTS